ncbi:MAG: porin [Nitrosomonadales bacterium]
MMNTIGKIFLLLMLTLSMVQAEPGAADTPAAGSEPSMLKFAGFGSLGVSHSSQPLGDYILDGTIPKGAGRSANWAMGNDTRLGAQVTASITPQVTAVLQIISEYQADNTYVPGVEWANVKYAYTQDAYIRVGRIALPTFLNSENRKVGYSYPWIHPPVDIYRQLAIANSDGIDAMYRFSVGEVDNSIKVVYGRNTLNRPTTTSSSQNMWGVFDTIEYGPAILHAGYQEREASSTSQLTGVTGPWVKNSDLSIGVSYDPGAWFAKYQWIQRKSTTKIGAMYLSAGVRIDDFTPYLTYSQNSPGSFLPGAVAPTAATIQTAMRSQSTVSAGVRWDLMRNVDLKVQYDRVRLGDNTNGYLANLPAGTILYGTTFHVISAVVDFVF